MDSFWVIMLAGLSVALLLVNVFRFNLLIVLAAICVNLALAQQPGMPLFMYYAAYLLAFAEATTGFVKFVFGNSRAKKKRRYVG